MTQPAAKGATWVEHSHQQKIQPRSQWSGWLITAGFFIPMLLAYVIFTTGWGLPRGTVNHGDLLVPATSLTQLKLIDTEGNPLDLLSGDKKWRWLIVGSNSCEQACQDLLYVSRQVHIRLGEKAHRLERVYLNTEALYSKDVFNYLQQEHPRLVMAHVSAADWQQTFANTNTRHALNGETLYVVDQEGFAMMTYGTQHQGNDMLDDIKRLLKYSYEDKGL